MFFPEATDYCYPPSPLPEPMGHCTYLPIEVDTEFTHPEYDLNNPEGTLNQTISVQMRSLTEREGLIYAHPDIAPISRHKLLEHHFAVLDYLEDYGYDVSLTRLPSWESATSDIPWLQIDLYCFFAVAELYRIFQGVYRDDIEYLCTQSKTHAIEQGRRLRTFHQNAGKYFNWVEMPWLLSLNGQWYRIRLAIYDTCAVHGVANYASFCNNSGVKLKYKDNFTSEEKSRMLDQYINRSEDFDNYSLGDLYNHDALMGNLENFKQIYESLELSQYFTPPRLTIGATVARLIESSIKKLFNADPNNREVINAFCKYGSADYIKKKQTTGALNAKVDGGRCRNNRPTDTVGKGVICDIDISGCYGEGLRVQTYPLGIPAIIDYPLKSKSNEYLTLRQFLKKYGKELVPGLWQARVSCKDGVPLKYKQDYLASWLPPKDISKMPTDSESESTDDWWDIDNIGEIKIFTNEVTHGLITHDFLQWLDNIASTRQRKEMLDKLVVETAMYYPASDRVETTQELLEAHQNHKGRNKCEIKKVNGNTTKISIEKECHKWVGVNLGELLVNHLLIERKKYPKKTPFNELYKLCINTIYGDMVSPFFTVGNVVVGNNITARARALAWCMEKGLHGWQSITDGCAFDVNKVLYPRDDRRISGEIVVYLYANSRYDDYTYGMLSVKYLGVTDKLSTLVLKANDRGEGYLNDLTPNESLDWVNKAAMEHLQVLFPGLDVLHQETKDVYGRTRKGQFEFEAKGFFDIATFHGTANYSLSFNGKTKFAMRSYSKKSHQVIELTDKLTITDHNAKPSEVFLLALRNPTKIGRSSVFLKSKILKVGDYRKNYQKWGESQAFPGCTVESGALLREFSLTQFTFQTNEQYHSWLREFQKYLNHYGQSYEMFFVNDNGTLNYQLMVETIDEMIREGKRSLFDGLDKRAANLYRKYDEHSQLNCLNSVRSLLAKRYGTGIYDLPDTLPSQDGLDTTL